MTTKYHLPKRVPKKNNFKMLKMEEEIKSEWKERDTSWHDAAELYHVTRKVGTHCQSDEESQ